MLLADAPDLTDRDRLAWAFGELRDLGWDAPYTWGMQMCCASCGWSSVIADLEDPDELFAGNVRVLFWHIRADTVAFCGTETSFDILPEDLQEQVRRAADLPRDDEEKWHRDHHNELHIADVMARTTAYQQLQEDLYIQWSGSLDDAAQAVAVLRAAGLLVTAPTSDDEAIVVHPKVRAITVDPDEDDPSGAVRLRVGMLEIVLSMEDVYALTESLDVHARRMG